MAKGRHLKHKLKRYNVTQSSSSAAPQKEAVVSVSDRIAQLRIEQRRSEQNRRARAMEEGPQQQQPMAAPHLLRDTAPLHRQTHVAGPPPPPSWRVQQSLRTLCSARAADAIALHPALASRLSIQTKQLVLPQLGPHLTDRVLRYFIDDVYSELSIAQAKVSYAAFLRGFWKTIPLKPEPTLAENWWEDDEDHDELLDGYVHQNDPRLDSVLEILNQRQASGAEGDGGELLTTPLSTKLLGLDIAFLPQFPASFGYLIAFTLPHLTRLVMPGSTATADVLLVLSRELKMLEYWDIGFHAWITPLLVCRDIRWDKDLRRLRTLCLAKTGPEGNTGQQVAEAMHEVRPHLQVQWEYPL
ncbi:hypothetical protein BX666DRAFT_2058475 [Dichotomocladium elegans]|nr:hypothetical protein BX666DRAFT_2058475 [Dichotomocladium elegans]